MHSGHFDRLTTEVTFLLTSGGHNAGIVSEPGHGHRNYQVMTRTSTDRYADPDAWTESCGGWLEVPIAGSPLVFLVGCCFYVFTVAALGILLGTVASTMGQFGLLAIPVILLLMLLSGTMTPMESMPAWLQYLMKVISPTPHFVIFAQDVLYRGADFSIVWPEILATAVIGSVYFGFALYRFRRVIFSG